MENSDKQVFGPFDKRDAAVAEINRLRELGYSKDSINVYGNSERARTIQNLRGVDVEQTDGETIENDEDMSWWETIKNSFNFMVVDADQGNQRIRTIDAADRSELSPKAQESISGASNILEPYSEDIADGKIVIVVDDYGEHSHS